MKPQHDAWKIGIAYEVDARRVLECSLGLVIRHNFSNSDLPDLEHDGVGIECKHRSGMYQTTSDHVRNQIMPKFYEGRFITRNRKRIFTPRLDKYNQPMPKQEYWQRFVLMDKIAKPTKAASKLLNELKIQIVTHFELCKWFAAYLKPKKLTRKARTYVYYSFSLMRVFVRKIVMRIELLCATVNPTPSSVLHCLSRFHRCCAHFMTRPPCFFFSLLQSLSLQKRNVMGGEIR
jgi:hypothetical protein